jgi:hypothetical protein
VKNLTDIEDELAPWKQSQNGSEYCHFIEIHESIRSQLQQEDKFTTTIAGFRYTVKDYDGKWLVFRRDLRDTPRKLKRSYKNYTSPGNIAEIKVFTLDEANNHLSNNQNSFELFGSDPVKTVNNEIRVVMARRIGSRRSNGEDSNDQ